MSIEMRDGKASASKTPAGDTNYRCIRTYKLEQCSIVVALCLGKELKLNGSKFFESVHSIPSGRLSIACL